MVGEGVLTINNLYVKNWNIFRQVSSKKIIVEGEFITDIETESIHLKQTGIIDGDLIYRTLIIESGGLLKSSRVLSMYKNNNLIKLKRNN